MQKGFHDCWPGYTRRSSRINERRCPKIGFHLIAELPNCRIAESPNRKVKLDSKIYIAGHRGLVGSAFMRRLQAAGYRNLITRSHAELELTEQAAVREFFERERPDHVVLAAARVGGIVANDTHPADFLRENLEIQDNVIHEAWRSGVKRLLFLGSS